MFAKGVSMLALVGLVGVALAAATFVDVPLAMQDFDGPTGFDDGEAIRLAVSFDLGLDSPDYLAFDSAADNPFAMPQDGAAMNGAATVYVAQIAIFDPAIDEIEIEYTDHLPVLPAQASAVGETLLPMGPPQLWFRGLRNWTLPK